ncbi:MAG TPA: acetyl-CoA hydrolase/transferase C-terminal domain-containing protein, partial [Acidimicrobiales bacterium]|nr:acetyl-CoA hydrolase/transferase C-terminal domain-containing protein [Acidimicrobiales bacterium]
MNRPPVVAYNDGADGAALAPGAAAALAGLESPEVFLGWTPQSHPWMGDRSLRGVTTMAGYALSLAVADGRIRYLPVRLSAVPSLLEADPPDVAVIAGVRRGGDLAFRGTVGWGPAATRLAGGVVVEVDEHAPDLGAPLIPGRIVAAVPRAEEPGSVPAEGRAVEEVDLAIGRNVVSVLPDEPTLQFGPGGIAEGVIASLDRPVRIWSGLVTDAMAGLAARGLLVGQLTAGWVWGGRPIAELARNGGLRLLPVEDTHDLTRVSAIPRFIGCNTALQVGLDGSVNVERVGDRVVAGIGGHADYCAAASRSAGGLSVIALRSTNRRGDSTIVPRVDVVSTPRCDVDVVVTEHGVADLRGVDDAERAERLVAVAGIA